MTSSQEQITQSRRRLTVLISGNGSNLAALIGACNTDKLPSTDIVRVISNKKNAFGLKRAEACQIPTTYHNLITGGYRKRSPGDEDAARREYDADLANIVLEDSPHLVVCAGFMHVLSSPFLNKMSSAGVPVINLHPSLPAPDTIKGDKAIQQAWEMFQRNEITKTGCMMHYVIEEVDAGKAICSQEVEMVEGESLEQLQQLVHEHEWKVIVKGTKMALDSLERSDT